MNIPKEIVDKLKTITELKLYCYILENSRDNIWILTWIEKQDIEDQYFIKSNQIPRVLETLVKEGLIKRIKKGTYKLIKTEDESTI